MNLLARPSDWIRPAPGAQGAARDQHYFAFLSYSHGDEQLAQWLHEALEKFRVPSYLVGRLTEHGPVPRRLTPIFRDLHELAASDDLGSEIRQAIAGSRFLLVLCSPAAAESRWTNAEIEAFKRVRPEGCIIAAIVAGEPFASDMAGREKEECFPPALRYQYDRRGKRTSRRAEPLAADLRGSGEARRLGFLKLVAGMLGLGLDDLVQRETLRRQRRMATIAGASFLGMLVATGLAVTALQARDSARDQRREAEGLIGFMLGDLREKLQPIGRLDALDGVGAKVLDYYKKQDAGELPDAALLQRSRALALMGEVAVLRGQLDGAAQLYAEAMSGTAEAVRRDPDDPQRLFDHAQNAFLVGELARQRGQLAQAEAATRLYARLAARMVALEPDNMRWRMEVQYAAANLGIVLFEQRRFPEASRHFAEALRTIEALATADPNNREYRMSQTDALAWLADAEAAGGRLDEAVSLRRRNVELLTRMLERTSGDVELRERLIPANRALAKILAAQGQSELALRHLGSAVAQADLLIARERSNTQWTEYGASARLDRAEHLLAGGRPDARPEAETGCRMFETLLRSGGTTVYARAGWRQCLKLRGQIAFAAGNETAALALSTQALAAAARVGSSDRIGDLYAAAGIRRLTGDVLKAMGDDVRAAAEWQAALQSLPRDMVEKPSETAERAGLLRRLGRTAELRPIAQKLEAMGYRNYG